MVGRFIIVHYTPDRISRNLSKRQDAINSCNGSAKTPNAQISKTDENPLPIVTSIYQDVKKNSLVYCAK